MRGQTIQLLYRGVTNARSQPRVAGPQVLGVHASQCVETELRPRWGVRKLRTPSCQLSAEVQEAPSSSFALGSLTLLSGCLSLPPSPTPTAWDTGNIRCTVHDDICALLEYLLPIAGNTLVIPQVLLAHVLDDEDTGELRVRLLGAPLGDLCGGPLQLPVGVGRKKRVKKQDAVMEAVWMGFIRSRLIAWRAQVLPQLLLPNPLFERWAALLSASILRDLLSLAASHSYGSRLVTGLR